MEDLVARLVAVSPIGAGLIIMAVLFLRYVSKRDTSWETTVKMMGDEQRNCNERCTTAVKDNTEVMGRVKQLLETRIKQVGGSDG